MENHLGISIVVPTFQEAKNIPGLVTRIAKVDFGSHPFEILLVDDNSNDGIVEIVNQLRTQFSWLKLLVRNDKKDLSQSVLDGFQQAIYPILVTVDADLSHPPEKIPEIITELMKPGVDLVIGSRYVPGGSADEAWPFTRKLSSRFSAWIARFFLSIKVKDPLSGFIAIRKETFEQGKPFNIIGWKWGLELIVKCQCKNIKEIPIHFSQRKHGGSKLNLKIALDYFKHIQRLKIYKKSID